ncbi:abortive infection family protein [Escherichia coli]|uniref:abortive infection family protein n=1 Tax=Escherichia coli TaxID=562 RepID=UPI000BE4D732|nr:abortive infection family protein [Escherichia coli]MCV3003083.1 abortive infection family protein [Escherichia coli]MGJ75208.1 abortive phage infection protein [Escherichia coli]HBE4749058.1 abortive infection family protein [Escherichia coli]HCO7470588.1 abortive infection family protein [Escherichia coli]HCO7480551.1 abortive infection family protein [Escherichia coli]
MRLKRQMMPANRASGNITKRINRQPTFRYNKMLDKAQRIGLAKILADNLNEGDWYSVCSLAGFPEYAHESFMKDVRWKNEGLSYKCIKIVENILGADEGNIKHFWNIESIPRVIKNRDNNIYNAIESYINGDILKTVTASPVNHTNENIYTLLKDAEYLIQHQGPGNAYDRIHTALHATLKMMCDKHGIIRKDDAGVHELLPLINNHLKAQGSTERNKLVFDMLRSTNSILDKANQLRNHHSNAHPNDGLLNDADAKFAINLIRSIMSYLDDLLGGDKLTFQS